MLCCFTTRRLVPAYGLIPTTCIVGLRVLNRALCSQWCLHETSFRGRLVESGGSLSPLLCCFPTTLGRSVRPSQAFSSTVCDRRHGVLSTERLSEMPRAININIIVSRPGYAGTDNAIIAQFSRPGPTRTVSIPVREQVVTLGTTQKLT